MATQRTIAQILVEIDNALKVGSAKLVKALHKDLLDTIAVSYLNRNDAADIALIGGLKNYDPARAGGYVAGEGFFIEAQLRQADVVISQGTTEAVAKTKSTQKTGLTDLTQYNVLPYDNGTSFPLAQLVIDENLIYKSLIANNTGNKPKDNPAEWAKTNLSTGLFGAVHVNGFYKLGDVITNPIDNLLYRLVTAAPDPFESTDLTVEIGDGITGDWVLHHSVNENVTGTTNNTIRLDALGNEEESPVLQNDGTDITMTGLLNVFGGVVTNGGLVMSDTNSSAEIFFDDLGNVLHSEIYIGDSNLTNTAIDLYSDGINNYWDIFTGVSSGDCGIIGAKTPENSINLYTNIAGSQRDWISLKDNSIGTLLTRNTDTMLSGISTRNSALNVGIINSAVIGGVNQTANEDNTAFMQRIVVDEHAKFLTDPILDLDWGDLSIPDKKYVDDSIPLSFPGTLQFQLGTTVSSGAAVSGFSFVSNELVWNVAGSGGGASKAGFWAGVLESDYVSGGEMVINLSTTDITLTTLTMTVYINGVVDATINGVSIIPSANNVFENIAISLGSAISSGDNINYVLNFTGANGDDVDVKNICLNYN